MIIYENESGYVIGIEKHWYGYSRGYTDMINIYIRENAFFIDNKDKKLLIAHEQGHIDGKNHTLFGVMSPYGLIRYLTSW